ncbi:MAG: PAS domain S-box protein [Spirochaetes bacterium]|nr:PAS domain S-box protein [Spirochaetota bacterium]
MKRRLTITFLIFIIPCISAAVSLEDTSMHVLLINSYHSGYKWTDDITQGVLETLNENKNIILSIEYMDSKKQFDTEYRRLLAELFKYKMTKNNFELIIVSDDNALNFVLDNNDTIFKNLPVVFCGINEFDPAMLKTKKNVTGVNENADFNKTLKLIHKLHPDARNFKFIIDSSVSGSKIMNSINASIYENGDIFSFELYKDMSMSELLNKIKNTSRDSVLFYTFYSLDSTGNFFEFNESIRMISESTDLPIYGAWDFYLGYGVIGGFMIRTKSQGVTAGKIALQILGGTPAENIPVIMNCEKKFMFDYNLIGKFNINEKELPQESEIIGLPRTFYTQNRSLVLTVSIYIAVLLLIIFILAVNMSARISAEKKLTKTKDFLRDIIESMPSMLITVDEKRTVIGFNKKVCDYSGLNPGLIKDGNIFKVFPEFLILEPLINGVFSGKKNIFNRSIDIQNKNSVMSALVSVYRLSDSLLREAVIRIDDVTEKVQRQEEMSKLRNLLADITNSMSSIIAAVDKDMNIIQWNSAAEKQTGIKSADCIGLKFFEVYPPVEKYSHFISEAITTKTEKEFIKAHIVVNNETRYFDILIFPLTGKNNIGAVIRIDDVTERSKMEEVLIQSEKMMSVGGLAAGMAHEINNPLAGIMQGAQVLQLAIDPEIPKNRKIAEDAGLSLPMLQKYFEERKLFNIIDTIVNSVQRAADIVTNMLSFSRKTSANMEFVNLAEIMDRTIELAKNDYDLKKKFDFKRIDIIRNYSQPLQLVKCHSSEIQQVIFNILKNGAQAMMENSQNSETDRKNRFTINIIQKVHHIIMEIEDNGPGMSEEVRKRVFEPFFTTKSSSKGIGLGLSVSYFIITENHKGTMNVNSVPGAGSKFIINLPVNGETDG